MAAVVAVLFVFVLFCFVLFCFVRLVGCVCGWGWGRAVILGGGRCGGGGVW